MSQNKTTTITEIIAMPAGPDSWINGSFKAIVTETKDPQGKTPGKAVLVDPDNPQAKISASMFGVYPARWEGMICSFSKAGMKRIEYKGNAQISIGEKARIDVFQAPAAGEPGKHMPIQPSPAAAAAIKVDFKGEIAKIGLMYVHAVGQARTASAIIKAQHGIDMTDAMFQSCVASIFIEANKNGLARHIPIEAIKSDTAVPKASAPEQHAAGDDEDRPF